MISKTIGLQKSAFSHKAVSSRCYGTNIRHSLFSSVYPFEVSARRKKNIIENFFNISGDGLCNLPVTKENTVLSTDANTKTKYF
jgi:hypothetical protein